ncbi:MAG TPA: type II toxin-antitoxin system RelE/ParE family toxin [Pyrinomonadaceae bacterium]
MIGYRFLTPANEELSEAAKFYEAHSTGLGSDYLNEVQHAIDLVCEFPELGQAIDQRLRRVVLHRFPFSLIYSVETDGIVIMALAHQRRRPGYWKSRV